MYGLLLLPVAIAFCAYALYMYTKRAAMIRRKDPGPCKLTITFECGHTPLTHAFGMLFSPTADEDRTGPIVLAVLLGSAILVNFVVKLYSYTR